MKNQTITSVRCPNTLYEKLRVLSFVKKVSIHKLIIGAIHDDVKTPDNELIIKRFKGGSGD